MRSSATGALINDVHILDAEDVIGSQILHSRFWYVGNMSPIGIIHVPDIASEAMM